MTMRSTKLTVCQMTLYLSCETWIRIATIASDSTADTPGRRSTASQAKFRKPQVSRNEPMRGTS